MGDDLLSTLNHNASSLCCDFNVRNHDRDAMGIHEFLEPLYYANDVSQIVSLEIMMCVETVFSFLV